MIFKWALQEIKNNKKFASLFVLNLCLGLLGLTTIQIFKSSIENQLNERSQQILTADLGVSMRGVMPESVEPVVKKEFPQAKIQKSKEMYSMIRTEELSKLVFIKAVESNFPFYGNVELEKENLKFREVITPGSSNTVVSKELLTQLELKIGESIFVGEKSFEIIDTILEDSSNAFGNQAFAPTLYINHQDLEGTNLIQEGSTLFDSILVKFNESLEASTLNSMANGLFEKIQDPSVRVTTHQQSGEQVGRLLGYLSDYLGLTALIGLCLAFIACSFLYRNYIQESLKNISIWKSLGASNNVIFKVYGLEIVLLSLIAIAISLVFAFLFTPALIAVANQIMPLNFEPHFEYTDISLIVLLSVIGSMLFSLPILLDALKIKPSYIFTQISNFQWSFKKLLWAVPILGYFYGLSFLASNSFIVSSLFLGSVVLTVIVLFALSELILFLGNKVFKNAKSLTLWSFNTLKFNRFATHTIFITFSLVGVVLILVQQLQYNISQELGQPETNQVPSLFLFDIQEEQRSDFEQIAESLNLEPQVVSPMIRAKLLKVNGKDFEKGERDTSEMTREGQREMRFRNRGFNLSYRDQLLDSETILQGEDFSGETYSGEGFAKVSIEERFAKRLNFELGDKLVFDVQGVPVKAQIENIRQVRWSSFQPNFFVQFQSGVLEYAPKTFLATLPKTNIETKNKLQTEIVKKLPNVSIIDVSQLIKRLLSVLTQMSWTLIIMTVACFIVGLAVMLSISQLLLQKRKRDIQLLKSIGANHTLLYKTLILESVFLISFALCFGGIIGVLSTQIMVNEVFALVPKFNPTSFLLSLGLLCATSYLASRVLIKNFLKEKSYQELFKE
ncbi:MAG: FtsX-like permease family protein [Bdellovibrionales bacterium]|nr:FtsX-like permease family protein [Bdellovibrionales bacterium]